MKKLVGVVFLLAATATVVPRPRSLHRTCKAWSRDGTGGGAAGATVTAFSAETGATRQTNTDAVGAYRFNLLPRGLYEVRAGVTGFERPSSRA